MNSNSNRKLRDKHIQKIKIVPTEKLEVGMFVCKLDRPWKATPFVFRGFLLTSRDDIDKVGKFCDWVYIDVTKFVHFVGKNTASGINDLNFYYYSTVTVDSTKPKKSVFAGFGGLFARSTDGDADRRSFINSLKPVVEVHHLMNKVVKSMMKGIQSQRRIDITAAREVIAACVDSIMENKEAMLLLTRIRHKDRYTSEHSVNVAITSIAFGLHMGMNVKHLNELGLCGLLHDMGTLSLPSEILNKPGPLTDEEMEITKRHVEAGRNLLVASGDIGEEIIEVAYRHHERLNGTGYPEGTDGKNLSLNTRIIAIVDVFDALTSDRVYRDSKTAEDALSTIHSGSNELFDARLVTRFTETIGTYPLGTIVEMQTGEVGLVVANNPTHRLRPRIKLLLDANKVPLGKEQLIDLGDEKKDSRGRLQLIKTSHRPRSFNIDFTRHVDSYAQG